MSDLEVLTDRVATLGSNQDGLRDKVQTGAHGATEEHGATQALLMQEMEKRNEHVAALAGVQTAVDGATQAAVLAKLSALEQQQVTIEAQVRSKHEADMANMRKRMAQLEKEIAQKKQEAAEERALMAAATSAPVMMSVNTDTFDAVGEIAANTHVESTARATKARSAVDQAAADREACKQAQQAAELAAHEANAALETVEALKEYVDKRQAPPIERITRERAMPRGDPNKVAKKAKFDLGTIEAVMKSHHSVDSALAWASWNAEGTDCDVHCAVLPKKGARVSVQWMKLHAQTMLPVMQVPKKVHIVDRLPGSRDEAMQCEDIEGTYSNPKPERKVVKEPQWKYVPEPEETDIPANRPKKKFLF
ncbi:hypothetical protein FVE85_2500 [Porphyridium purpureum]|uniref:Uncharacterized protein n=1 Tax=Porphyridium purpureum TaxID=35688 RepID=A0A5J4YK16_PORPP|nr:hypothetical protein FVE85_2500 [Porphyridium purpureum]|eukprot:POR7543..scf291_13